MPNNSCKDAFQILDCPPYRYHVGYQCGLPKSIMALAFCTPVSHNHEIIHSAWLTSKLGPEAISSVRKCIFTTHIHKINAKLCKETNKTS